MAPLKPTNSLPRTGERQTASLGKELRREATDGDARLLTEHQVADLLTLSKRYEIGASREQDPAI
jgi:hypothetical protein